MGGSVMRERRAEANVRLTHYPSSRVRAASERQHRADAPAPAQVLHRLVDLGERPTCRDEPHQIEPPGLPEPEEARDVADRVAAPERAAEELLLADREQRRRRDRD